jgi:pimeloyl-ACP methyl ester carboxylesterase
MHKVASLDGTTIAYEKAGEGPPILLLGGGFRTHEIFAPLISDLEQHCTCYAYDRRGRGESGDAPAYAVEREIEDMAAVIAEAGGEAVVFGGSSGAILALEAAMAGVPITKLALMEPSYRPEGYPRPPEDFEAKLRALLAEDRRDEAAEYFLAEFADFPSERIAQVRRSVLWPQYLEVAHTLVYDTVICADYRVPVERLAALDTSTLLITSKITHDWLLAAAQQTAAAMPNATLVSLPGVHHVVPPEVLGPALIEFVTGRTAAFRG